LGIEREEVWVCDFCGKRIDDLDDVMCGRIYLREQGEKGLGRCSEIALHKACCDELTRCAFPVQIQKAG
jgi:hypothetical protein